MADDVKDEMGSNVLFEDEHFKVWDLLLQPGQAHGTHRHTRDDLLVFIGDTKLCGVNEDGSTGSESGMPDAVSLFLACASRCAANTN